jgi:glycosyltransferase involved in cell wall biosynthesis
MAYDVAIWCPDRHIVYDGDTPNQRGVGGGITARVRMARALARRGHRVTVVANCARRATIDGVAYVPLDQTVRLKVDVLILNTSGGDLDLTPVSTVGLHGDLQLVWVQGVQAPTGLKDTRFEFVYCVSEFIARIAKDSWGVRPGSRFISYNAFEEVDFSGSRLEDAPRDPYRLVYFSHPSKGRDTAVEILRLLRALDPRFHLEVFGSEELWGGTEGNPANDAGVVQKGLIGQNRLAAELLQCTYSLQLQDREEPGALAIMEALRAGCILLASPVGCYPEMIANGVNGFLIQGDHRRAETRRAAAETISALHQNSALREAVQQSAQAAPWSSDTMAAAWVGHWDWWFDGGRREEGSAEPCSVCSGATLSLADGLHCLDCSSYRAKVTQPAGVG